MCIIWAGSVLLLIFFSVSAVPEIWFFVSIMAFLLFLTIILYDKAIIDAYEKELNG
jgi:hypothetical protein